MCAGLSSAVWPSTVEVGAEEPILEVLRREMGYPCIRVLLNRVLVKEGETPSLLGLGAEAVAFFWSRENQNSTMIQTLVVYFKCKKFTFPEPGNITMAQTCALVGAAPDEPITWKNYALRRPDATFPSYNIGTKTTIVRVGNPCGPGAWCDICMNRLRLLRRVVNVPHWLLFLILHYAGETMPY